MRRVTFRKWQRHIEPIASRQIGDDGISKFDLHKMLKLNDFKKSKFVIR